MKPLKKPARASAAATALPAWNLSHLVAEPVEKNIQKGLAQAEATAAAFQKKYAGKLKTITPRAYGQALAAYEKLSEDIGRLYSYTSLLRTTRLDDAAVGRLHQGVMEKVSDISTQLLFFGLETNRLDDKAFARLLTDKTVARYRPYLEQLRVFRPYQLPDAVEKAVHERGITGGPAWVRMFDETLSRLRFPVGGKQLTETELFHLMLSPQEKTRRAAAKAAEKVFGDNAATFGFVLNTLVKEKEIDDRQRGYKTPAASRHLENQVEDAVVEALVTAVRDSYPRLSHRYYRLKAKWMGVKKLNHWDRNAPLPFASRRQLPWPVAQARVLKAYGGFHPEMARIATRFFDENWIDAAPRAGKDSGAFSAPTVPAAHPYILMNYKGGIEDVMTLAHEMGHGVHQVLSAKQGYFMSDTPLTLAETASVFGEMLTFQSLLADETNPLYKKAMLAKKVEDMLNTVVRQVAFHTFETRVHTERRNGELTPDDLGRIWMEVMRESLGPAFTLDDGYRHFWAYISHFYHVPFYVYAYAFGDCLVNALYAVYRDSEKGFAEKYLQLLQAGGTKRYDTLLKPFGLDARDPAFWQKGLSLIEDFIDQLESAEKVVKVHKSKALRRPSRAKAAPKGRAASKGNVRKK